MSRGKLLKSFSVVEKFEWGGGYRENGFKPQLHIVIVGAVTEHSSVGLTNLIVMHIWI